MGINRNSVLSASPRWISDQPRDADAAELDAINASCRCSWSQDSLEYSLALVPASGSNAQPTAGSRSDTRREPTPTPQAGKAWRCLGGRGGTPSQQQGHPPSLFLNGRGECPPKKRNEPGSLRAQPPTAVRSWRSVSLVVYRIRYVGSAAEMPHAKRSASRDHRRRYGEQAQPQRGRNHVEERRNRLSSYETEPPAASRRRSRRRCKKRGTHGCNT